MFKKALAIAGTALLAGALTLGPITAATAAPVHAPAATAGVSAAAAAKRAIKPSVTLKAIAKQTVVAKTVTVRPSYKTVGKTRIISARLTVKQGKKALTRAKSSAKLEPGTYKVTQSVKYQLASGKNWGKAKTATKTQTLTIGVLPWMSFGEGLRAGHIAKVNTYRKAKGLKPLVYNGPLTALTYTKLETHDYAWLDREKVAFSAQSGVVKKARNTTWFDHGFTYSERRTVPGSDAVYYRDFLKKDLTKIGVTFYVFYDVKKRPMDFELWSVAR